MSKTRLYFYILTVTPLFVSILFSLYDSDYSLLFYSVLGIAYVAMLGSFLKYIEVTPNDKRY